MCTGMNADKLEDDEVSISSSNRNFVSRQGSKDASTILANPQMVVATAVTVDDVQHEALVHGTWDMTALQRSNGDAIEQTVAQLPYVPRR